MDEVYAAMSEGSMLNPDPRVDGDDDNGDFFGRPPPLPTVSARARATRRRND